MIHDAPPGICLSDTVGDQPLVERQVRERTVLR
jgi:hypothetical protein